MYAGGNSSSTAQKTLIKLEPNQRSWTDASLADSDESGHLFQSVSDTIPGLSDSCRSEATL